MNYGIMKSVPRAQGKKYTDEAKIRIVKKFYKMKAARRSSEDKKSWKSKFQIDEPAKDTVTCQIGQSSSNKHSHSPRMITWKPNIAQPGFEDAPGSNN
uniref:Ovule protein n=1 Tax=Globodera pallida TaxID=36090 RepID=A0A183CIE0_GLOPA